MHSINVYYKFLFLLYFGEVSRTYQIVCSVLHCLFRYTNMHQEVANLMYRCFLYSVVIKKNLNYLVVYPDLSFH